MFRNRAFWFNLLLIGLLCRSFSLFKKLLFHLLLGAKNFQLDLSTVAVTSFFLFLNVYQVFVREIWFVSSFRFQRTFYCVPWFWEVFFPSGRVFFEGTLPLSDFYFAVWIASCSFGCDSQLKLILLFCLLLIGYFAKNRPLTFFWLLVRFMVTFL